MGPKTSKGGKPVRAVANTTSGSNEVNKRKPNPSTKHKADLNKAKAAVKTKTQPPAKKTAANSGDVESEKQLSAKENVSLDPIDEGIEETSPLEDDNSDTGSESAVKSAVKTTVEKKGVWSVKVREAAQSKPNGKAMKGPVSKKTKAADVVEEEMEETNSKDGDKSSEPSDKPAEKKGLRARIGKKGAAGKSSDVKSPTAEHANSDDDSEVSETEPSKPIASPPKKRTRQAALKSSDEPDLKKSKTADAKGDAKPKLNQTSSNYGDIKFDSAAQTKDGKKWNFKISSWNVAGLKAWAKKDGLDFIKYENPDVICLQETKCAEDSLPPGAKAAGYHSYWLSSEKPGYAGVALLSKMKPINVQYGIGNEDFDNDGRLITAEYEKFFLVAVYVPNAGQKLKNLDRRMEWDPLFRAHLMELDEKKPVILCGDMNVSHTEIDLANPKTNTKSAGFTPEEREGFSALLKAGFVDTFRHLYPDKTGAYTFWTYMGNARSRNTGWRLDYFILSERFVPSVCDNVMRNDVYGSDHCPITLLLHI